MESPPWEVCVCKVSGGLLQRAGSSETKFSAAPENGLVFSLQSGRSSKFMYLKDTHRLIFSHQTYVDVQCEGHVLNALQIQTHLILQQLYKVGTSSSYHFTDQKMEAVLD